METLEKLFGSSAKVKVMRLFVFNPDQMFDTKTVSERTRLTSRQVRKEIAPLYKIKLLKQKGRGIKKVWHLNEGFTYLRPLQELLRHTVTLGYDDIVKKVGRTCRLKSLVLSGLFINSNSESRVDMLIIGNQFHRDPLQRVVKKMEAEIGRELRYAVLDTEDFQYRLSVGDRLVRDVLEFPHQVAYDRIGLK